MHYNGYGSYQLFLSLRLHFNSKKYDYFSMHGKTRASKDSYNNRNDKWFFDKLAKRYNQDELQDFYVANILEDRVYVTDMMDEEAHSCHFEYVRRQQAATYNFTQDLDKVFEQGVNHAFAVSDSEYPYVVILYLRKIINIETMVILDDMFRYTNKFDKHYEGDIIWPKISQKIKKFRPFLSYDRQKVKNVLREVVNEQRKETEAVSAKAPSH